MRTLTAIRGVAEIPRPRAPRATSGWRALIAGVAAVACAVAFTASAADPAKVLRIAQFDIDTLDPQQFSDDPSFQVIMAIFEPMYEWDYLSPTPKLTPLTAAGTAGSDGRRAGMDDAAKAGHSLHRRSGVQGKASRAHRRGLHLFVQALARSERAPRRPTDPHRPHPRRAAGRRSRQEDGQARFRRADRGTARARPLHAADPDGGAQLSERCATC